MQELLLIVAAVIVVAGVALGVELQRTDDFGVVRRLVDGARRRIGRIQRRPIGRPASWHEQASPVRATPISRREPEPSEPAGEPLLRRPGLWRDSAIVLFAVCAVGLAATALLPTTQGRVTLPSDEPPTEISLASPAGSVGSATATPAPPSGATTGDPSATPLTTAPSPPAPSGGPAPTATVRETAAPPAAAPPATAPPVTAPTATATPTATPPPATPRPTPTPTPTPAPTPTPTSPPASPGAKPPKAKIAQSVDCISVAGFVRFDGRGSTGETSYYWEFGDGGTSTRPAPIHAYGIVPNVYTVTLTVTGPGGTDTATSTVTVPCP